MAARTAALREQVRRATWDEIDRVGLVRFHASVIIGDFAKCGVGRSTLVRWIAEEVRSGAPERVLARQLAALGSLSASSHPSVEGHLAHLGRCITAASAVVEAALADDGTARHPRLLLAAVEQLRLAVEATAKVCADGDTARAVAAFVAAVAEQVQLSSPEVARNVAGQLAKMKLSGGGPVGMGHGHAQ